jgi:hypothetical protein
MEIQVKEIAGDMLWIRCINNASILGTDQIRLKRGRRG